MNCNNLRVYIGCALTAEQVVANQRTYELLSEVCMHGEAPCGSKVVVKQLTPEYGRRRFAIVSNPIRLDTEHIAFYCDDGNLCFGYTVRNNIIYVHTD